MSRWLRNGPQRSLRGPATPGRLASVCTFSGSENGDTDASGRAGNEGCQVFWGKPRLRPPCEGSSQRLVTALVRVKKWTASGP